MASQSKLEKLRSSAFFQEFPPEYFEQLVDIGREIELPARTTVFKDEVDPIGWARNKVE
jgi:hypothetical protein